MSIYLGIALINNTQFSVFSTDLIRLLQVAKISIP